MEFVLSDNQPYSQWSETQWWRDSLVVLETGKINSYAELGAGAAPSRGARRRQFIKGWKKTMGIISKTFGVVFSLWVHL